MAKFLSIYLLLTGVAAFLALAMPSLVVLGFFLLIIPGLLLSLAPSAFLFGCVFTLFLYTTGRLLARPAITVMVSAALTAVTLVAIPELNRLAAMIAYQASLQPDIVPLRPLMMQGAIRLDLRSPRWDNANSRGARGLRGFSCDNLCVALLFSPGVTSVTINKSGQLTSTGEVESRIQFNAEAKTYRLKSKAQCSEPSLVADLTGRSGLFSDSSEKRKALDAEWNLRLASDVCLVSSEPVTRHDILILEASNRGGRDSVGRWSFKPRAPTVQSIEIRSAEGGVLLRRFKSSVRMLTRPLHILGEGGIENFRFGWATTEVTNKPSYDAINLLAELDRHTNTVGRVSGKDLLPALRDHLRDAMANPALASDAAAFKTLPAYFDALKVPLSVTDLAIVADLARDDRLTRYEGIWQLKGLPTEQQRVLRTALAERALSTDQPSRLLKSGADAFLAGLPAGSYTVLTPAEETLLTLPERRWALPALAARLDEAGPARVPMLLSILEEHARALRLNQEDSRTRRTKGSDKSGENDGHRAMLHAGRKALCKLGPSASTGLQPLEALLASGLFTPAALEGHSGSEWNLTLARLGKPLEQLNKPARLSGSDETHRAGIQRKLANFDPARHC